MISVPTGFVVLIGLLFNISAALITHVLIEGKNNQLSRLSIQMRDNEKEINLLWGQVEGIERKRETLYLLINQGQLDALIAERFSRLLALHLHQIILVTDIESVDKKIENYQDQVRDEIDNKFFLNLELGELQRYLQSEVSSLRNWSLFLQMIGLSLILVRDLSRKLTY